MENHYYRSVVFIAVFFTALVMSSIPSAETRDLRPTEHGLDFQSNITEVPKMQAFFDGNKNTTSAPKIPIPEAKDPSDEEWWRKVTSESKGPSDRRKDRVRKALMVATLVCGTAGVALLAVAAFLFIVQSRRQKYAKPTSN
ncbi:uncharacterized protein LOC124912376 [Impatiens glandulifera]|uniref:uncharacterized protein LOC124912376 n=1 Tax=Impatiens glandulifera TaxID=253017 RepID=UPI001FB0B36D|nr:uncharacterized protein LOC124912376 [Impatiens glandulifera]